MHTTSLPGQGVRAYRLSISTATEQAGMGAVAFFFSALTGIARPGTAMSVLIVKQGSMSLNSGSGKQMLTYFATRFLSSSFTLGRGMLSSHST